MEERPDSEDGLEVELTPEELVAADEAMLLDLGGAEQLADLIADQSLGAAGSGSRSGRGGPTDPAPVPGADEEDTSPAT